MAISKVSTILPLDTYAEYMDMPGWLFNQVTHPERPRRGGEDFWRQSGYYSDPNRIAGRDSVARAMATAERKIADYLGFWPGPRWTCEEPVVWQKPKKGVALYVPKLRTRWGYLIEAGTEAWDELGSAPVVYTDEDGDGVFDWATVTFDTYLTVTDACEAEVVPPGRDPSVREWRIRQLNISISAGVITIEGPRWLFVDPDVWLTIESVSLDDDTSFLETVDLYRHYTDTSTIQARVQWTTDPCNSTPCTPHNQNACMTVTRARTGEFYVSPATYGSGAWVSTTWARSTPPDQVFVWYLSGYQDWSCGDCSKMSETIKQAIVRLTNVYLPELPCGKGLTRERWLSDRQKQDMNSYDVALAQSAFGTTARGAVFARSALATLEPLGKGG